MKKLILLFALTISMSAFSQTILYESDDFIVDGWSVVEINTPAFGFSVDSNPGLLSIDCSYTDTIRFSLVKGFTNISGMDSIEIHHNIVENPDVQNQSFKIQFFTSIDSVSWTPLTSVNSPSVDSFMVYQSDLNTVGNTTYIKVDFTGDVSGGPSGFWMFSETKDIDITTDDDLANSISEIESATKIFNSNGKINIESESVLKSVEVFSLDGRLIHRDKDLNSVNTSISISQNGIYIVHVNGIISKKIYIE
jgi:hypothetical protein